MKHPQTILARAVEFLEGAEEHYDGEKNSVIESLRDLCVDLSLSRAGMETKRYSGLYPNPAGKYKEAHK